MNRMAGGLQLSDFDFGGVQTVGAQQGSGGKLAAALESVRSSSPKFGEMEQLGIAERAKQKATAMQAEADVFATATQSAASVESARLQAEAAKAAARSQAQGSMMGSALGAVGSIAGALFSDKTTKHDINHLEEGLSILRKLNPVTFYYNKEYSSQPDRLHHGFIAQEYVKVLPDATYIDDDSGKMCIDTRELIAILVRANQELESRVARLELQHAPKELSNV